MAETILDIVNENDEIIGSAPRSQIHKEGLLHREIHVWFVTPDRKVILQRRSATKDRYPNLLHVTVGGHVEQGDSYEKTAIKEVKEETGLDIDMADLVSLGKSENRSFDELTGTLNHAFRHGYAYLYRGSLDDLMIEEGEASGFELWPISALLSPTPDVRNSFVPNIIGEKNKIILDKLAALVAS